MFSSFREKARKKALIDLGYIKSDDDYPQFANKLCVTIALHKKKKYTNISTQIKHRNVS